MAVTLNGIFSLLLQNKKALLPSRIAIVHNFDAGFA